MENSFDTVCVNITNGAIKVNLLSATYKRFSERLMWTHSTYCSGVTLPVGARLPKKAPPLLAPLPFWCPSLKLNKLGDFREKSLKKCISRAKRAVLLVL